MNLSEFPHLQHALSILATDIGATLQVEAVIPEKWVARSALAEAELSKLNAEQIVDFVIGEETDQETYKLAAPNADILFMDAFDGDLSDIFYQGISSGFDYKGVEAMAAKFTQWKKEQV
jgi:hypothetical protein